MNTPKLKLELKEKIILSYTPMEIRQLIKNRFKLYQYNNDYSELFLFSYRDIAQISINYAINGLKGGNKPFNNYLIYCKDNRLIHLTEYFLKTIEIKNIYDVFNSDEKIINFLMDYNKSIYSDSDIWFNYNELVNIATNYDKYSKNNSNAIFDRWFIIEQRFNKIKKIKENINEKKLLCT